MKDPGSKRILLAILGILIFIVALAAIGFVFSHPGGTVVPSPSELPGASASP